MISKRAAQLNKIADILNALEKLEALRAGSNAILLTDAGIKDGRNWMDGIDMRLINNEIDKAPIYSFKIGNNFNSTQERVVASKVGKIIQDPKVLEIPGQVVKDGDQFYILDGNHRALAAKLLGLPFKAHLLTL